MHYIIFVFLFISNLAYSAPTSSCSGANLGYLEKVLTERQLEALESQETIVDRANFLKKINSEKHKFIDDTFSLEPTLVKDSSSDVPVGVKMATGDDRPHLTEGFPTFTFQEVTFGNDRHWIVHAIYRRADDSAYANDLFRALYLEARQQKFNGQVVLQGEAPLTITQENVVNSQTLAFLKKNNWKPGTTYKYKSSMVNQLIDTSPNAKSTMNILADFGLELDSITYSGVKDVNLIFNIKS